MATEAFICVKSIKVVVKVIEEERPVIQIHQIQPSVE